MQILKCSKMLCVNMASRLVDQSFSLVMKSIGSEGFAKARQGMGVLGQYMQSLFEVNNLGLMIKSLTNTYSCQRVMEEIKSISEEAHKWLIAKPAT